MGCGAAGALLIISQLNIQPVAAFSVSWSAQMIFVTVIGGIGTIEGPIIGTFIFYILQQTLADQGAWYLVLLGAVAIIIAIWAPRGIWGLVTQRVHIRFFPVGYWLWQDDGAGPPAASTPQTDQGPPADAGPPSPDTTSSLPVDHPPGAPGTQEPRA